MIFPNLFDEKIFELMKESTKIEIFKTIIITSMMITLTLVSERR